MTIRKKIALTITLFIVFVLGIFAYTNYSNNIAYKKGWINYYDNYFGLHYAIPKSLKVIPSSGGSIYSVWQRKIVISDMSLNQYNSPTENNYLIKPYIKYAIGGAGDPGIYKGMYITIELHIDDEYTTSKDLLNRKEIKKVNRISNVDTFESEYTYHRGILKGKNITVYLRKDRRLYSMSGDFQDTDANNKLFRAIASTIILPDVDAEKKLKGKEYVPVNIVAENAYIKAKDISMVIDGQLFHLPSTFKFISVPISYEETSMEMEWTEKDLRRMFAVEFRRDTSRWWVSEIRMTDVRGEWIKFDAFKGAEINKEMSGDKLKLVSKDSAATLWLTDYHIQPFTYQLPPPEASGYRLINTIEHGKIKLFHDPTHMSGYGMRVKLYDREGNDMTDTATYQWTQSNPDLLNLNWGTRWTRVGSKPGDQATNSGVEFDSNRMGTTTVIVKAFRKDTNEYLASTSFEVSIVDKKEFGL